jgi:hypothetical protein
VRLLDALVRTPEPGKSISRYSFSDFVSDYFTFGGSQYGLGYQTTFPNQPAEPIGSDFQGYVNGALKANGVISAVEQVRLSVFSEARFQFQRIRNGRPGDLFGDKSLALLEQPWTGGATGDLLTRMLLDADLAGNSYTAHIGAEMVRLRPDWVDILMAPRVAPFGGDGGNTTVGMTKVGYHFYDGGRGATTKPALFLADEVAHFAPYPDPLATFRGMSWLTPVLREIQADSSAMKHKLKFFENAASPNLAVSMAREITPAQFQEFIELMDSQHKGVEHAYKTLYTAGGADVKVIGSNLHEMDFKHTQGHGETRIASAGRIHPVLLGLSEGLAGSSLNAGNFGAARRSTADGFFRPTWRNVCGSLEVLVPAPAGARLWYDGRDVAFLREDEKDLANIQNIRATTIRTLVDAGFKPDSVIAAVTNEDDSLLVHSGLYSVQLQAPGSGQAPAALPV